MQKSPPTYRFILTALSPVLAGVTLWQAWKSRNKRFALQRLGFAFDSQAKNPLWIHCASVGEVNAAKPLINLLRNEPRFAPILVSTATPTGADTVLQQGWSDVQHAFLPLDHTGAVNRAFRAIEPRALLLMETEIWPNLINTACNQRVPVVIFNGRLSKRTLQAPKWLLPIYKQALSRVTAVLAKSSGDAEGFAQLGAPEQRINTLGNLKFAAIATAPDKIDNPIIRPFWLAASTHEDEEFQLCQALRNTANNHKPLLVIAPRHPKRSVKIQEQLTALNISFAVRSKEQPIEESTEVYLADTLGEMSLWLQHAQVVFMGGSLVPVGGHNLLEPAAAAAPIVSGPHLHNFLEEAALLRPSGALHQVESADDVVTYVESLMDDSHRRDQLGEAGRQAVQSNANMLERYTAALLPLVAVQQ